MQDATHGAGRATGPREMETSFGFAAVEGGRKQGMVDAVFASVATRYDLMNDLMSAGVHRLWKSALVARLAPPRGGKNWKCLDIAGGTGDIAMRIVEVSGQTAGVTVLDISAAMLEVGRQRVAKAGLSKQVDFVEGNAEALPFADGEFDACTIALGIRNVPRIDRALAEARRVLKFGGRFLCLEFSEVDVPWLDRAYDLWSRHAIPRIGEAVTGDGDSYRYLVQSIAKFPNQASFAAMLTKAGFARVGYTNLTGGIAAIHSGWKL
jgi:demethylmenaquinone methyltransferase/2-methoxy-6-polyprenyl-1,4-benzoquinol methylase